ncbi:VOC family protein [Nocardia fusca]|uniref:VOC family protein n=1 Tax=Nocardia fusca TaxID=941183 RepID=UPI0037BD6D84
MTIDEQPAPPYAIPVEVPVGKTPPVFKDTLQIGIVVRDLDRTMRTYIDDYGIGPWTVYDFNDETVDEMMVDGEPRGYSMRLAVAMVGKLQWELIEPTSGDTIYSRFLAEHGEGVQHIALDVENYQDTVARLSALGRTSTQSGRMGGVTYSYFSTEKDLKVAIELYSRPLN